MDINNKHFKNMKQEIDNLNKKEKMNNEKTRLELLRLEKQRDISEKSIADSVGRILGYFAFNGRK